MIRSATLTAAAATTAVVFLSVTEVGGAFVSQCPRKPTMLLPSSPVTKVSSSSRCVTTTPLHMVPPSYNIVSNAATFVFGRIASVVIKKLAIKRMDLSDNNKKIMNDMGTYDCVVSAALPNKILGSTPYTDDSLKTVDVNLGWLKTGQGFTDWEKGNPTMQNNKVTKSFEINILEECDMFGAVNPNLGEFLRNRKFLPFKDKYKYLDNDDAAKDLLDDLKLLPGQANPTPYLTWDDGMTSDEAMSRIFFYGIGSVLMLSQSSQENKWPDLGPYVVDLDISTLRVRKKWRAYGFRIHFDSNQKVTAIYDYPNNELVKPDDGTKWDLAKHLVKQTTFTVITAREHLQWTHLIGSNAATRASNVHCPPSHPIRRLLTVFTYNTNYVNNNAEETLVPRFGIVHRATAFKYTDYLKVFESGYKLCNIFEPFPNRKVGDDIKKLANDGSFPFYTEGVAWFEIVRTFVKEWLNECGDSASDEYAKAFYEELVTDSKGQAYELPPFSQDALVETISQLIFTVTAYHEIVGTVVDYTLLPSRMGFRAGKGALTTDTQSFLGASALTGSTAITMPMLVGKFDNFMGEGGAPKWEKRVWSNFQDAIQTQSKVVQAADAQRIAAGKPEFKNMDPAKFECAVSV